jgi:uncharacterized protein (DUF427 family)
MPSRESLYSKLPDYRVDLEPCDHPVRVRFNGEVVADSARALTVVETKQQPVIYFPREDVHLEFLDRSDHSSFCPFKGDASYWTLRVGDLSSANAVWSYEDPFPEVAGLKDHIAFYADRVQWERDR